MFNTIILLHGDAVLSKMEMKKFKKIIKKASKKFLLASLAGVLGIEPSLIVLETTVLPIYDTPKYKIYYILCYT